jgi:hypothetical protein
MPPSAIRAAAQAAAIGATSANDLLKLAVAHAGTAAATAATTAAAAANLPAVPDELDEIDLEGDTNMQQDLAKGLKRCEIAAAEDSIGEGATGLTQAATAKKKRSEGFQAAAAKDDAAQCQKLLADAATERAAEQREMAGRCAAALHESNLACAQHSKVAGLEAPRG